MGPSLIELMHVVLKVAAHEPEESTASSCLPLLISVCVHHFLFNLGLCEWDSSFCEQHPQVFVTMSFQDVPKNAIYIYMYIYNIHVGVQA